MTFAEFQLEVFDGAHIVVDDVEHVVLLSKPGLVTARPENTSLTWNETHATVKVTHLTADNWDTQNVWVC